MRTLLSVTVLVFCAGVLSAATIHVPADQPTIQAGIDAESSGNAQHTLKTRDRGSLFAEAVVYSAGTNPQTVAAADFDSDGHLDLAVANYISDNISVFLNDGTGLFPTRIEYAAGDGPWSVHTADLDGDGDVDLAAACTFSNTVSVLFNDGTGVFDLAVSYGAGNGPIWVTSGLLDDNESHDLIVANIHSNDVSVLVNNGDGSFQSAVAYAAGGYARSVTATDLDGDGAPDLAVANHGSNTVSVLRNVGDATFEPQTTYPVGTDPHSVRASDLDGDGDQELVAANNVSGTVSVLQNQGDGTFLPAVDHSAGGATYSVFPSDLDGDGLVDLAVAGSVGISILLNSGDLTFAPFDQYSVSGAYPTCVIACDLNEDGTPDLVTANSVSNDISVLINQRPPRVLNTYPTQNELNVPVDANITVTFDIDMDPATINDSTFVVNGSLTGKHSGTITYDNLARTATIDSDTGFDNGEFVTVVLTNGIESELGIPLENGYTWCFVTATDTSSGVFTIDSTYSVGTWPHSICSGDLDSDGDNDLITGNKNSVDISILLNNGDGDFDSHADYPIGGGTRSVCVADFDADGDLDIASANNTTNDVSVLLNFGDGTFGAYSNFGVGNSPYAILAADLDADGAIDLAVANAGTPHSVSVLLNTGNGTFMAQSTYSAGDGPHGIAGSDFDSDGDIDLVIANFGSDDVSVLMNDGSATFEMAASYPVGSGPWSVLAGDLNGDSSADLAIANRDSDSVSILFNNGFGEFSEDLTYPAGNAPVSISISDLDGDGDMDMVVAADESGDVTVLLNLGAGTFATDSTYWAGDRCYSVVACDLDGDGDSDIATANLNGNTASIFLNISEPLIQGTLVESQNAPLHVVSHTPLFEWVYFDASMLPQTQVELAVGTDDDWQYAEMWNPAPFQTPDTFITYAGIELVDGDTYYLRLRVHNGVAWSDWYETSFRMNSLPSVPVPLHPLGDVETGPQPVLWTQNSTDAEGDTLTYDFFCVVDTTYGEPELVEVFDVPEQPDSTGWQVSEPLHENWRYFWRVRSHDGYEYSDWTDLFASAFFVNGTPEPPTAPQAQYPPDTSGMPVFDMLTYFYWLPSSDPDPLDTVRYKLEVSIDPGFTFVNTIDSLMSTPYTLTDSLAFSTHYWWRVTAFDNTGMSTMSPNTPDFWTWTLGDLNHSHAVDISDLVMLVDYMFNSGPAPYRLFLADIDGSCAVDISDLVYLVDYMFLGGPAPLVGCG